MSRFFPISTFLTRYLRLYVEQEASIVSSSDIDVEMVSYDRLKKKGRGCKKPFPEDLPRQEVIIDLKEEEKFGGRMRILWNIRILFEFSDLCAGRSHENSNKIRIDP